MALDVSVRPDAGLDQVAVADTTRKLLAFQDTVIVPERPPDINRTQLATH